MVLLKPVLVASLCHVWWAVPHRFTAACHFLLNLVPPGLGGDFPVSSSPVFSLLWSSDSREFEETDKEDTQTQKVESGQWQASRSGPLHGAEVPQMAIRQWAGWSLSLVLSSGPTGCCFYKDDRDESSFPRNSCLVMEKVRQTDSYRINSIPGIDIWRQNKQGFRQYALMWHLGVWMVGRGRGSCVVTRAAYWKCYS